MSITPEQLREIAFAYGLTRYTISNILAEFQKLQAEQEPVAEVTAFGFRQLGSAGDLETGQKLYAAPPDLLAQLEHANEQARLQLKHAAFFEQERDELAVKVAELEAHEKQLCAWIDET